MKKLKKFLIFAIIIFSSTFFSCGEKQVVGKWQTTDFDDGYFVVYEFTNDGKAKFDTYVYGIKEASAECDYRIKGNKLIITENGEEVEYKYTRSGDKLSIESDGVLLSSFETYKLSYNEDDKIIGTWYDESNPGQKYVFNSDGSGKICDDGKGISVNISYATSDGNLYIYEENMYLQLTADNIIKTKYSFDGEKLVIGSTEEERTVFVREK